MDRSRLGFFIILGMTLIVCVVIFFTKILPSDVFHWDEGHHALYGMWLSENVSSGDWESFWANTHRQAYWPFFHSWLLAAFFLIFNMSYAAARALSLALFIPTVMLTYLVCLRADERLGWIIGIVACSLCLTSPFLLDYASLCMIEMPGALIFVLAAYLYLRALEEKRMWLDLIPWGLLGLVLGISMVTKYNYALHIIPAVALVVFIDLVADWRSGNVTRYTWLKYASALAPLLLITVMWFTSYDMERKISMVLWTKETHEKLGLPNFFEHYFYYFRTVIDNYFFSRWLGLLSLASAFGAFYFSKNRTVRSLAVMFLASLFISTFILPHRLARGFLMEAPWLIIIFSFCAVRLFDLISGREGKKKFALFAAYFLVLFPSLLGLSRIPSIFSPPGGFDGRAADVLEFIDQSVPGEARMSTVISSPRLSPYTFTFHFRSRPAPALSSFDARNPAFLKSEYFSTVEPLKDKMELFEGGGLPGDVDKWNSAFDKALRDGFLEVHETKDLPELGVRVKIFRRAR